MHSLAVPGQVAVLAVALRLADDTELIPRFVTKQWDLPVREARVSLMTAAIPL
jgi:hypothetical protein